MQEFLKTSLTFKNSNLVVQRDIIKMERGFYHNISSKWKKVLQDLIKDLNLFSTIKKHLLMMNWNKIKKERPIFRNTTIYLNQI